MANRTTIKQQKQNLEQIAGDQLSFFTGNFIIYKKHHRVLQGTSCPWQTGFILMPNLQRISS